MYTANEVFESINVALAPVEVHFATILPPFRLTPSPHASQYRILRASPSFTVGFCVVVQASFTVMFLTQSREEHRCADARLARKWLSVANVRERKSLRQNGGEPITRAEFDDVLRLLDERGEIIAEMRRELRDTCLELSENVRRELRTQFTRIAQMQQEIDELKRNHNR